MNQSTFLTIGAAGGTPVVQLARMSNRHGLIAGATGTGKTITLQVLAEAFSRLGVPVFAADIKGDLSGLGAAGQPHRKIEERLSKIPLEDFRQRPYPVIFWDIFGLIICTMRVAKGLSDDRGPTSHFPGMHVKRTRVIFDHQHIQVRK